MSDLLRDHCLMAENELDELYRSRPEQFTALRARLATTAKERGDVATAKQISAARKPTTAAWIVNRLALSNTDARQALTQLGERLRAAHAAMNGERIRKLSAEQRALVDELSRAAFEAAEVADPSGALRDDVTGTLQAAIADPDVAARLGRLAKAERWSGFGELGDTATVLTVARRGKAADESPPATHKQADKKPRAERLEATRQQRETARTALAAAERAQSEAAAALSERQAELAAARRRHDQAREDLDAAEHQVGAAEEAHLKAKQANRVATELMKKAKARLEQVDTTS